MSPSDFRFIVKLLTAVYLSISSDSDSDSDSSSSSTTPKNLTRSKHRRLLGELDALTQDEKAAVSGGEESDDESGPTPAGPSFFATKHEILVPDVLMPSISEVGPEEALEQVGEVMSVIDSVVVVKGRPGTGNQVLDSESILVFDDRQVLGQVNHYFRLLMLIIILTQLLLLDIRNFWSCHRPALFHPFPLIFLHRFLSNSRIACRLSCSCSEFLCLRPSAAQAKGQ